MIHRDVRHLWCHPNLINPVKPFYGGMIETGVVPFVAAAHVEFIFFFIVMRSLWTDKLC